MYDFGRDAITQVTQGAAHAVSPVWTPDGTRIIFGSLQGGRAWSLFAVSANGSRDVQRLTTSGDTYHSPGSVSPDGRSVLFTEEGKDVHMWVLPLDPSGRLLRDDEARLASFRGAWSAVLRTER